MDTNPNMTALLMEQRLDELDQTRKEARALENLIDYTASRVAALAPAASFHPENQGLCEQALRIAKDRLNLLISAYGMDKDDLLIGISKIQTGRSADDNQFYGDFPNPIQDGRL
jgi:hypothetical protein